MTADSPIAPQISKPEVDQPFQGPEPSAAREAGAADEDLFWQHLKSVPAFRALLRTIEARFYRQLDLVEPVLDLGCGDGHFADLALSSQVLAGIDPWWGPLRKAKRTGAYAVVVQSNGDRLPFPDHFFASIISNSVLEHIPDLDPVMTEASRVLKPGGMLVITTPSHYFTQFLGGAEWFERLGLDKLADLYRRFFNLVSRHAHTDSPDQWAVRLAAAGFHIERWQYYFSRQALHALELGHVQGLPSAALHALTGHWIIAPWEGNLSLTERWLRPYFLEPFPDEGTMMLIVARKESDGPTNFTLPDPSPLGHSVEGLAADRSHG